MKRMRSLFLSMVLLAASAAVVPAQISLSGPAGYGGNVMVVNDTEVLASASTAASAQGVLYLYKASDDGWKESTMISAPEDVMHFGQTMARDGDRVLVGASTDQGEKGVLVIMERDGSGSWKETGRIMPSGSSDGDRFGYSVAIHGDWMVASSRSYNENMGAVYVFNRMADGKWIEKALLTGEGTEAKDEFGVSVALDSDVLLVGSQKGVHVFSTNDWQEKALLVGDDVTGATHEERGGYGVTLALHDGMAVVGAPMMNNYQGAVYIFSNQNGSWTQMSKITPDTEAGHGLIGLRLGAWGDHLFSAAPMTEKMRGSVVFYSQGDEGQWEVASEFYPAEGKPQEFFAGAVNIYDGVAAVGSMGANFGTGRINLFTQGENGSWVEQAAFAPKIEKVEGVTGEQVDCEDGEAAGFTCMDVDLISFVPVGDLGGKPGVRLNDLWGWTDPETGKEYALVGRMDGTSFVDISDPLNPVFLGDLPMTEGSNAAVWRDIKVYKNHAYIVADGAGPHGMQVFDLTRLRNLSDFPVTFDADAHYDNINSAHNIVINEETGYAYAVGASAGGETCGGGLHIIDIRQPLEPSFVGCFADAETGRAGTGYSHDAQCIVYNGPDTEHVGKEVCFGSNETALSIADVTDKENPVALSSAPYPNVAYSHQGWITDDHRYFFLNDELDELSGNVAKTRTLIWDVTDLDDPQLVKEFLQDEETSDHNLYIKGNMMYQSNYVSGLQIFDITDVTNPVRVGYFDTVKGENKPGFDGSWSNYPFFKSGVIAFTSVKEGLFLVRNKSIEI